MRALLFFLLVSAPSFAAGPLIFGVRGGATVTDSTSTFSNLFGAASLDRQFSVGPTVGVRLPLGFSVEGDALYTRQDLNLGRFGSFLGSTVSSESWQFPVMAKYTFSRFLLSPVVGAGVSVRHLNDLGNVPSFVTNTSTSTNNVGFVAGAGFRFKLGPVALTPEYRYTRWNSPNFTQSLLNVLTNNRDQQQVLLGLTF